MNLEQKTTPPELPRATPTQTGTFSVAAAIVRKLHTLLILPLQPRATPTQAGTFSVAAAIVRILPTLLILPFNFAPVGGLAVFTGARMRSWLAYGFPLAVLIATDMILWALKGVDYSPLHQSRPFVYGSYMIYVLLGRTLGRNLVGVGAAAILGSIQFFLLTNFSAWLELVEQQVYAPTFDGLIASYAAGVPFYRATFVSDLVFPFVFIGLHYVWVKAVQPAPAQEGTPS